jgi:hypothetical protein
MLGDLADHLGYRHELSDHVRMNLWNWCNIDGVVEFEYFRKEWKRWWKRMRHAGENIAELLPTTAQTEIQPNKVYDIEVL